MELVKDMEQFNLLEEKIDSLIQIIQSLKEEKTQYLSRIDSQEKRIEELSGEIEKLHEARDTAKEKIISLLQKIEQIEISV